MTYRVRIFLLSGHQSAGRYIGEHDLREAPRLDGRIAFEHDGRTRTGRVEGIAPIAWHPDSALIPSLHVREEQAPPKRG